MFDFNLELNLPASEIIFGVNTASPISECSINSLRKELDSENI